MQSVESDEEVNYELNYWPTAVNCCFVSAEVGAVRRRK